MSTEFDDFDDIDMDLDGDSGFEDGVAPLGEKRSPVESALMDGARGFKDGFLGNSVQEEIGRVAGDIAPALVGSDVASEISNISGTFTDELTKTTSEMKKHVRPIVRSLKKIAPKTGLLGEMSNKVLSLFDDGQQNTYTQSEESILDSKVANAMSSMSMFNKDEETQAEELAKESIKFKQIQDQTSLSQIIATNTDILAKFSNSYSMAYYKKSLELQHRQVFLSADIKKILASGFDRLGKEADLITKNTALPDFVKLRTSEELGEQLRNKTVGKLADKLFNQSTWLDHAQTNIRGRFTNFRTSVTDSLGEVAGIVEEVSDAREAAADMEEEGLGGQPSGPGGAVGDAAAGFVKNGLIEKMANIIAGNKYTNKIFRTAQEAYVSMPELLTGIQSENKDNFVGTLAGFFGGLIKDPNKFTDSSIGEDDLNDNVMFDKRTQTSIVKVIPGLLSKILAEVTSLRTGGEPEELKYDYTKDLFTKKKDFKQTFMASLKKDVYRSGVSEQLKTFIDDLLKNNPDVTMSKDELEELSKNIFAYLTTNKSLTPMELENNGFYKSFKEETVPKVKQLFNGTLTDDEGVLNLDKNKDMARDLRMLRGTIDNPRTKILDYKDNGKTEELINLEILKFNDDTNEYDVDLQKYYDLVEEALPDTLTNEYSASMRSKYGEVKDADGNDVSVSELFDAGKKAIKNIDKEKIKKDAVKFKDDMIGKAKALDKKIAKLTLNDLKDLGIETKENAFDYIAKSYKGNIPEEERKKIDQKLDKLYKSKGYNTVKDSIKNTYDYVNDSTLDSFITDVASTKKAFFSKTKKIIANVKKLDVKTLKENGLDTKEKTLDWIISKHNDLAPETLLAIEKELGKLYNSDKVLSARSKIESVFNKDNILAFKDDLKSDVGLAKSVLSKVNIKELKNAGLKTPEDALDYIKVKIPDLTPEDEERILKFLTKGYRVSSTVSDKASEIQEELKKQSDKFKEDEEIKVSEEEIKNDTVEQDKNEDSEEPGMFESVKNKFFKKEDIEEPEEIVVTFNKSNLSKEIGPVEQVDVVVEEAPVKNFDTFDVDVVEQEDAEETINDEQIKFELLDDEATEKEKIAEVDRILADIRKKDVGFLKGLVNRFFRSEDVKKPEEESKPEEEKESALSEEVENENTEGFYTKLSKKFFTWKDKKELAEDTSEVVGEKLEEVTDKIIDKIDEKLPEKEKYGVFDRDKDGDRDGNAFDMLKFWESKDNKDNENEKPPKKSKSGNPLLAMLGIGFFAIKKLLGSISGGIGGVLTVGKTITGILGSIGSGLGLKNIAKLIAKHGFKLPFKIIGSIWESAKAIPTVIAGAAKGAWNIGNALLHPIETLGKAGTKLLGAADKIIGFFKNPIKSITAGLKAGKGGIGKLFSKGLAKKIPGIGLLMGIGFAINRFKDGDYIGGAIDLVSGLLSTIPGLGTLGAIGADMVNFYRDSNKTDEPIDKTREAAPETFTAEDGPDIPVNIALKEVIVFTEVANLPEHYQIPIREFDIEIAKLKMKIENTASDNRKTLYSHRIKQAEEKREKLLAQAKKDMSLESKEVSDEVRAANKEKKENIGEFRKLATEFGKKSVEVSKEKDPIKKAKLKKELAVIKTNMDKARGKIPNSKTEKDNSKKYKRTIPEEAIEIEKQIVATKEVIKTTTSKTKKEAATARLKMLLAKKEELKKKSTKLTGKNISKATAKVNNKISEKTKAIDANKKILIDTAIEAGEISKKLKDMPAGEEKDTLTGKLEEVNKRADKARKAIKQDTDEKTKLTAEADKIKKEILAPTKELTNAVSKDSGVLKGPASAIGFIVRTVETNNRYNIAGVVKGESFLSFGAYQFTEKNGNLKKLLSLMLGMNPSYKEQLKTILGNMNSKGYYTKSRSDLKMFLKQIGNDPVSKKAQDIMFYKNYYKKAEKVFKSKGHKNNLVLLHLVDANVNGGMASVAKRLGDKDTLADIETARLDYWKSLKGKWAKYAKGWTNRLNRVSKLGKKYIKGDLGEGGLDEELMVKSNEDLKDTELKTGAAESESSSGPIGTIKEIIKDILEFFGVKTNNSGKQDGLVSGKEAQATGKDIEKIKNGGSGGADDGSITTAASKNNATIKNPIITDWKTDQRYQSLGDEAKTFYSGFSHYAAQEGIGIMIPWMGGNRMLQNQKDLYAKGRSKPGKKVTWTLNSFHIGGRAIDIISNKGFKDTKTNHKISVMMREFAKANPEMGARFLNPKKDPNHIEFPKAKKIKSFNVEEKIKGTKETKGLDEATQEKYGNAIAAEPVVNQVSQGTPTGGIALVNEKKTDKKGSNKVGDGAILSVPKDDRLKGAHFESASDEKIKEAKKDTKIKDGNKYALTKGNTKDTITNIIKGLPIDDKAKSMIAMLPKDKLSGVIGGLNINDSVGKLFEGLSTIAPKLKGLGEGSPDLNKTIGSLLSGEGVTSSTLTVKSSVRKSGGVVTPDMLTAFYDKKKGSTNGISDIISKIVPTSNKSGTGGISDILGSITGGIKDTIGGITKGISDINIPKPTSITDKLINKPTASSVVPATTSTTTPTVQSIISPTRPTAVIPVEKQNTDIYSKDRLGKLSSIDDTLKKSLELHKETLAALKVMARTNADKGSIGASVAEPITSNVPKDRKKKVVVEREPLVQLERKTVKSG